MILIAAMPSVNFKLGGKCELIEYQAVFTDSLAPSKHSNLIVNQEFDLSSTIQLQTLDYSDDTSTSKI